MKTPPNKDKKSLLDKLKVSKREANIFFFMRDSEIISTKRFKVLLPGLKANDKRLYNLFQNLDAHGERIVFEDFIILFEVQGLLKKHYR